MLFCFTNFQVNFKVSILIESFEEDSETEMWILVILLLTKVEKALFLFFSSNLFKSNETNWRVRELDHSIGFSVECEN